MNQYDTIPPDPELIRRARIWAVCIIAAIGIMLLAVSCSEKEPLPTLEGAWEREWIAFSQRYNFNAGGCAVYSFYPWKEPVFSYYSYYCDGDKLVIFDLSGTPIFKGCAIVSFPTDSTAVLSWEGGVDYLLKRL